jgi:hypothetical protein
MRDVTAQVAMIHTLADACRRFAVGLGRESLPQDLTEMLADRLRAAQHFVDMADAAARMGALDEALNAVPQIVERSAELDQQALSLAGMAGGGDPVMLGEAQGGVERAYEALKAAALQVAAQGRLDMPALDRLLERARLVRFAAQRLVRAARRLQTTGLTVPAVELAEVP